MGSTPLEKQCWFKVCRREAVKDVIIRGRLTPVRVCEKHWKQFKPTGE